MERGAGGAKSGLASHRPESRRRGECGRSQAILRGEGVKGVSTCEGISSDAFTQALFPEESQGQSPGPGHEAQQQSCFRRRRTATGGAGRVRNGVAEKAPTRSARTAAVVFIESARFT